MPLPKEDTSLGGADRRFPSTRWSVIRDAGDPRSPLFRKALDELCRAYWKPVYAYLRKARDLGNEAAKDLTQQFFLELIDGGILERYSPESGGFRGYLLGAAHLFLLEEHRSATTQKRGGGRPILSLDDEEIRRVSAAGTEPDEAFNLAWARTVVDGAVAELKEHLRQTGRERYIPVFERCGVADSEADAPSYASLASELGIKESDVSNYLVYCRKKLRVLAIERIRDTVTCEPEAGEELLHVYGLLTRTAR